jgi:hypothetical protein
MELIGRVDVEPSKSVEIGAQRKGPGDGAFGMGEAA